MELKYIENVNAYNCILASVATLAKHYGRDYQMIADSSWTLKYNVDEEYLRIGNQIDVVNQVEIRNRAIQFHGFTWKFEEFDGGHRCVDDFAKLKFPFLASVDLYYSRWSNAYKKYHFLHCIIICGYNSKDNVYSCVDPYYQYANYNVTKDDLFISIRKYGELILYDRPQIIDEDYFHVIKEDITNINCNENYENIKQLALDFYYKLDINYEFDEYKGNLYAVPIMEKIRKIALYRDSYACMLDYIFQVVRLQCVCEVSRLIKNSATLWKILQSKLLKTYLSNSIHDEREKLCQLVFQIAEIEKEALETLKFNIYKEK